MSVRSYVGRLALRRGRLGWQELRQHVDGQVGALSRFKQYTGIFPELEWRWLLARSMAQKL